MNIDEHIAKYTANPTMPRDKTNGAQSSLDKTVATQTQQKYDPTPEQREGNESAQYANPNNAITKATDASVNVGYAGVDQPELKSFYGMKGTRSLGLPSSLSTGKGVYEFKTEKATIPEGQQQLIRADREMINFKDKKANSGAGLDVDYAIPFRTAQTLISMMESQGKLRNIAQFAEGSLLVGEMNSLNNRISEMLMTGTTRNDPALQALITEYKIQVGLLAAEDKKSISISGTKAENASLFESYSSYIDSTRKLNFAIINDGEMLQSRYDSLISEGGTDVTRKIYYDLHTAKDTKHYDTASRRAKEKLLVNPYWQAAIYQAEQTDPVMAEILQRESKKGYISESERKIISRLNTQIGPQMREAYERATEVLGKDEADIQYRAVKEMFDIYSNLTHKKVIDDLAERVYGSDSFGLMESLLASQEDIQADGIDLYEEELAKRTKKLETGKRAQQDAYQNVWGGGYSTGAAAVVSASGGKRKIGHVASRIHT